MTPNQLRVCERTPLAKIRLVNQAIREERRLMLSYPGSTPTGETDPREPLALRYVSPYEVRTAANGNRLLIGWDHEREQYRSFSLAKVAKVGIVDAPAYEASA